MKSGVLKQSLAFVQKTDRFLRERLSVRFCKKVYVNERKVIRI